MCKTFWQGLISAFSVFCMFCLPSLAQDAPRLELFGSYSYVRYDSPTLGFKDFTGLNGGNIGFTYNLTTRFGVVGEIGGAWGSPFKFYDGLAGPRYTFRRGKISLFGQGLFGKAKTHVEIPSAINQGLSSSAFAFAGSGGVDYSVTNHFSIRAIQVDYIRSKAFELDQGNLRFSVGLIYHIGQVKRHKRPQLTP